MLHKHLSQKINQRPHAFFAISLCTKTHKHSEGTALTFGSLTKSGSASNTRSPEFTAMNPNQT
ncbi:MAG: hypothetical protein ACI9OH_001403 [Oleispira sp.]|jgi:hypothetical protein